MKKEIGIEKEKINEIIDFCLNINIFDKELYQKCQILTSKGIQKRYFTVCKRRKEVEIIKEYLLIKPQNYGVNVYNNSINDSYNKKTKNDSKNEEIKNESNLNAETQQKRS